MARACDMAAAILVGGQGTRLQSVVSDRPKVLAEISGKPFLAYLFDQLLSSGICKVVLCSGYMADKIKAHFGNRYNLLSIQYSREGHPLGTGGGLRLALPYLTSDTILVMNGDSYIDTNLGAYIDWFLEQERQASLLLAKMEDTSRYGTVIINKNKTVAAFKEKCDNAEPGWINAGIYLMKRALVSSIPAGRFYSLERDFFPSLTGGELCGYCGEGRFIDIGTPEAYVRAESFFAVKSNMGFAKE
jgi:NDP-sugar pyrophosphorylase family protein